MSVSLTLVFDRLKLSGGLLAYDRLALNHQDYDLFDRIAAEAVPMIDPMSWYEDEGLEEVREDSYGKPLTSIPARALARHFARVAVSGWDAAVLVFVNALPPDARIVLWWH